MSPMSVLLKKTLLLFLILLGEQSVFALQPQIPFTYLDINQGLIHNQVNCIIKDNRGFLWFGTPSGLSRYDGQRYKNFQHTNEDASSLRDNYINNISNLPDGKLWITTGAGTDIYDPLTLRFNHHWKSYLHKLGLPVADVSKVLKDPAGAYWFIYPSLGVVRYRPAAMPGLLPKVSRVTLPGADSHEQIADIGPGPDGSFWYITTSGWLGFWDQARKATTYQTGILSNDHQHKKLNYRLFIDDTKDLWMYTAGNPGDLYLKQAGGDSSFKRFSTKGNKTQPFALNNDIIYAIAQDKKGGIWVGTDHGGLNLINKKDFHVSYIKNNQENPRSLAQNCIYSLYKDDKGIMWVGTYKKGVCYYDGGLDRFPLYSHDPNIQPPSASIPFEDVNRFVQDKAGNFWIGTNGGGLIFYNQKTGRFKQYKHDPKDPASLCANVIVGLCYDSRDRLWIGTYYGGLDCYQDGQFRHYRHNPADSTSLSDDRVWDIYEDAQRQIWVGTLGGGLQRFEESSRHFIHYPGFNKDIQGSNYILVITQLKRNKDLWVGTAGGIDIYHSGGKTSHLGFDSRDSNSISNNNINAIHEDASGLIWIGTREGLNCYNPQTKSIQRYSRRDGLHDNTILTILEADNGDLWMSSPSGLMRFNPPAKFGDTLKRNAVQYFDESDGLQGREFNEKSAYKTTAGALVFGGANGFNIFQPDSIRLIQQTPPVVFTDLLISGKTVQIGEQRAHHVILPASISETKTLTLPYGASDFSIAFAALSYAHANRIKYAFRLVGFNDEWIISQSGVDNKATYTNLDPGTYTLEVKSCNQDGIWSKSPAKMQLSILPPFWKTSWAYLLYFLVIAGILYLARNILLYRAGMRFQLQQQKQLAQHTHEMDIMKIRFFTNISHEFRTPLSLILAPLDKILKEVQESELHTQLGMVQRNAKRLLYLVNQLLDFRKLEVQEIKLQPVQADITTFVKETAHSFTDIAEQKNIRFLVTLPTSAIQATFDPAKLERILLNLLSNAFKFTPEHGQVSLTMDVFHPDQQNQTTVNQIQIQVKDSGIGIPPEKTRLIFERFFQLDRPGGGLNPGSGIGLSITQEFVRLHQGTIQVESAVGKGSLFTLRLPVLSNNVKGKDNIQDLTASTNNAPKPMLTQDAADFQTRMLPIKMHRAVQRKANGHKPTILLVEDHEDFRFYLKDNLQVYFNILEAANGKEGMDLLLNQSPDLVVSDIMMTQMDGIQLCKRIRKDPRTVSVPLILLTAKASEEQQLEGFKAGANDYMVKPFNFEMLLARIQNLLTTAKKQKKEKAPKVDVRPTHTIETSSIDEAFLQQAQAVTEARLSDPDFSVEQLSQALFVSRVTLYKKIVAITGQTPVEFIRKLRVKKAAGYLSKGLNVQQTAYEVGFNNPKYFTKYFKQEFGQLPSAYARQHSGDNNPNKLNEQ